MAKEKEKVSNAEALRQKQTQEELALAEKHRREWQSLTNKEEGVGSSGGKTSSGVDIHVTHDPDPGKGHRRTIRKKW